MENSKKQIEVALTDDYKQSFRNKLSKGQPIFIRLKNLTDEKIYNVELFNHDFENQKKIEYSSYNNTEYSTILQLLQDSNDDIKCGKIVLQSSCEFQKFQVKQLISPFKLKTSEDKEGTMYAPAIDPYQQQTSILGIVTTKIVDGIEKLLVLNKDTQITWDYLMPETEAMIYFWVNLNNKK